MLISGKAKGLSEKFAKFENNVKELRGFYVTKMKKDQVTGHYFGVATWISRNTPLPGSRTNFENRWSMNEESPAISHTPSFTEPHVAPNELIKERERRYRTATENDFSKLAKALDRVNETDKKKSSLFDPYDSYDL